MRTILLGIFLSALYLYLGGAYPLLPIIFIALAIVVGIRRAVIKK